MQIRRVAVVVVAAAVCAVAGACSSRQGEAPGSAAIPPFDNAVVPAAANLTLSSGLDYFPSTTVRDWVSYADHVSVFTVLAEQQLPWGEHELTYGEGMVGRDVTVRVDRVLWQGDTAPAVPSGYTAGTIGWALKDNELSPMGVLGGPRLEVGEQYVGAWIHSSADGWLALSPRAVFPTDDYARPQRHAWTEASAAGDAFIGKMPDEISEILYVTDPDPVVHRYSYLEPLDRLTAVMLERLPDRPGFVRAARGPAGQMGYVREQDWQLARTQDLDGEIPFFEETGDRYEPGEGGDLALDGFFLDSGWMRSQGRP